MIKRVPEPDQTVWSAPIVFGTEKNESLHFCAQYRRSSGLKRRRVCPAPRMDLWTESLNKRAIFCKHDAISEYLSVEIDYELWEKVDARALRGVYIFLQRQSIVQNDSTLFQPATLGRSDFIGKVEIGIGLSRQYCRRLTDSSGTSGSCKIRTVMKLLHNEDVTTRLKKCRVFMKTMSYMTHFSRMRGLKNALYTTDAISRNKAPRILTKLNLFVAFCNVFRRFVSSSGRSA